MLVAQEKPKRPEEGDPDKANSNGTTTILNRRTR
jgi:hypothetical protein